MARAVEVPEIPGLPSDENGNFVVGPPAVTTNTTTATTTTATRAAAPAEMRLGIWRLKRSNSAVSCDASVGAAQLRAGYAQLTGAAARAS